MPLGRAHGPALLLIGLVGASAACTLFRVHTAPPGATFVAPRGPDDPPPPARTIGEALTDATDPVLVCEPGDRHGQWECRSASRLRRERARP